MDKTLQNKDLLKAKSLLLKYFNFRYLSSNGINLYLLGGCVRDCFLGVTPKDYYLEYLFNLQIHAGYSREELLYELNSPRLLRNF